MSSKGKSKGKSSSDSDENLDGCEYCGGDLSMCFHAGTVPVTVNMAHANIMWTQIELLKINGDVLTVFDLAARDDLNPRLSDWKVRDLLEFLISEMQSLSGPEAARNIYLTPNGLCLSKVDEDLASFTLHEFMALSRNPCCDPEWHGWYCHVCGTQW
jgi:hypothetical protein